MKRLKLLLGFIVIMACNEPVPTKQNVVKNSDTIVKTITPSDTNTINFCGKCRHMKIIKIDR